MAEPKRATESKKGKFCNVPFGQKHLLTDTCHSLDDSNNQHQVPLGPPNPRLLPQKARLRIPPRSPLHRRLPSLWPRRARQARHPQAARPLPATLRRQGLLGRPALLRLLVQADAVQPGRVRQGRAAG